MKNNKVLPLGFTDPKERGVLMNETNEVMRLYRVTCQGMTNSMVGDVIDGVAYVVAKNSDEAYKRVWAYLEKKDIGYPYERELDKVELVAESADYPRCQFRLFE